MARQANWEKHGYETAKGKRGTGWMTFNKLSIEELLNEHPVEEYPNGIPLEAIDDHAHGWFETEQFQYEAGEDMKKWAMREAKKEGDEEGWVYNYGDKESEWQYGYVNYMVELMKKNKVKIDD